LERWERVLETVSLWRFLPCPVHGDLSLEALRVDGGSLTAVSELSRLRVGDPAVDLAAVSGLLDPDEFDAFAQEYFAQRSADDAGLLDRVEFMSEFAVLQWFLATTDAGDEEAQSEAVELLAQLSDVIGAHAADAPDAANANAPAPTAGTEPGERAKQFAAGVADLPGSGEVRQPGSMHEPGERGDAPHITADIDRDRAAFRPAAQASTGSHALEPDDLPTNRIGRRTQDSRRGDAGEEDARNRRERWDDSEEARRRSSLLDTERTDITRD